MVPRSFLKRLIVGLFVCTAPVGAQDSGSPADAFYSAIRENDLTTLQAIVKGGADVNLSDPRGGARPLMYAAAVGSIEAMTLLIDNGADINAVNGTGATALIWAAPDIGRVKLLLSKGADVKAASQRGRTALFVAARSDGSAPVVRLLLSVGADAKAADATGISVLYSAADGNDTETIRLLVEAGADVNAADALGFTPLIHAAGRYNIEAVKLLLAKGANVNAMTGSGFNKVKAGTIGLGNWTPLTAASQGPVELVRLLLDAGAKVDVPDARNMTALMLAAASDRPRPDVVRLLLARGANVNALSTEGETPLDWARKIGAPQVIQILKQSGAAEGKRQPSELPAPGQTDLKTAVLRSRMLLNRMSVAVATNGGCASCHSHNILEVVDRRARAKGLPVDPKAVAQRQSLTRAPYLTPASMLERFESPGFPDTTAYALYALATSGYAPDRITDAMAVQIAIHQAKAGYWTRGLNPLTRPPIEDSDMTRAAIAIRGIGVYAPPGRRAEFDAGIQRAKAWLAAATPVTGEDRNMQLLGLHWAGAGASQTAPLAKAILARQRSDGSWSQTDSLSGDAYATGQALFALSETDAISTMDPAYQKGVRYLLTTQRPDGSWHVSSRSPKFQPFFDGGFPYGHDQWISSMATGWATAALLAAMP